MTNFSAGRQAEEAAASYLKKLGFKIVDQNWRTRFCEIDIVAQKDGIIYFVEVKYRLSDQQGSGFEYITPKKLKQMQFAAEMWVSNANWSGEYCLSGIEVSGSKFAITDFVDCL